jgi:CheY-like chemotaxis protein/nitrogen-specific signal transduction histidine kinase
MRDSISITGASQNVTERLMHEAALAKSKEEAERANHAKSEFLSRMSHELRTPLNAILGFGQLIKMDSNKEIEGQNSYLDHIIRAGHHLLELVDEVLDLSRIESGNFSVAEEHINASETVGFLISQIQPFADEKSIKILNHLAKQDSLFVRADRKAFSQIIINLLDNAVKYNSEAGSITVDCGASGDDNIWISVSDTGPGIGKEDIEKLFEPFNRLGQESGGIKGTGIGLSISKILAERLGGSLSAECELGNGCRFKVVLPAGSSEFVNVNKSDSDSDVAETDIQSKGHKVLYIEDNDVNLSLVEELFKTRTHICFLSATHARDGIEIARTHRPDLILMDMQLPDMDGTDALRELQKFEETSDIPVIAVSAEAMADDIRKALNSGFEDYVTKPLNFQDFWTAIDKVLNIEANEKLSRQSRMALS